MRLHSSTLTTWFATLEKLTTTFLEALIIFFPCHQSFHLICNLRLLQLSDYSIVSGFRLNSRVWFLCFCFSSPLCFLPSLLVIFLLCFLVLSISLFLFVSFTCLLILPQPSSMTALPFFLSLPSSQQITYDVPWSVGLREFVFL